MSLKYICRTWIAKKPCNRVTKHRAVAEDSNVVKRNFCRQGGLVQISDQQKQKVKEKAISEVRRFAAIVSYLWVLLSLFELHRFAVLREVHQTSDSGYRFGLAAINAFVLGKVILIAQDLHLGERFGEKRIVNSALFKSAVFALLLVCFDVLEEVIVGVIHGKSVAASVPQIGGGGLEGKVIVGIIGFVVLIPFFLFTEMQRVLGKGELHSLIFRNRPKADAA